MKLRLWIGRLLFAGFLFFAVMTAASRFIPHPHAPAPEGLEEDWRPGLASVRSIDDAMKVLPAYIAREHGSREARVTAAIDHFVRDRFIHGNSLISYHHNWLAALSGMVWVNLRMPVIPDDILHHRRAICSQQAIVFMELLKRYHIHYGAVMMSWPALDPVSSGHFAVTARVDGRWLYFDTDQEAEQQGVPVQSLIDGRAVRRLYAEKPQLAAELLYAAAHHQITVGHVDSNPAPHGSLFQRLTGWLSSYGWLLLGLITLGWFLLNRRFDGGMGGPMLVPAE